MTRYLNKIKHLLLRVLPEPIVHYIKIIRKKNRLKKRFLINKGEDIKYLVNSLNNSFYIFLNPYLNGGVDGDIFDTGEWEPEIGKVMQKYLKKDGYFLDIGANIGYHSLFASNVVGSEGKVFSFEPIPRIYEQFSHSVEINKFRNIKIFNTALSDTGGEASLSLVDENIGASSLKEVDDQRDVGSKIVIKLQKLDFFKDEFSRLDFVKIDVEGNEYEVLMGGADTIKKFLPVIVLEFSAHLYESDYIGKSLDIYNFLINLGYKITTITGDEISVPGLLAEKKFVDLHRDLLCIPILR